MGRGGADMPANPFLDEQNAKRLGSLLEKLERANGAKPAPPAKPKSDKKEKSDKKKSD